MEKEAALKIIQQLANGTDPHSGEVFRADSPYQHPDTVRALFTALRALEGEGQPAPRQRAAGNENAPQNAGKPWSGDEDKALAARSMPASRFPNSPPSTSARALRSRRGSPSLARSSRPPTCVGSRPHRIRLRTPPQR